MWRQMLCVSATKPIFFDREHRIEPGEWLYISAKVQKDAAMAYLPRLQIIDAAQDPLVKDSYSALAEIQIPGDGVDTLYHIACSYQNTGASAKVVKIRMLGKNASGNVYAQVKRGWRPVINLGGM
jgi:hypothetical protein